MLKKNLKTFSLFLLLMILCVGCQKTTEDTVINTGYKVLASSGIAYDTAMKLGTELYQNKTITEEQYQLLKDKGEAFYTTYQMACTTLLYYYNNKDKDEEATKLAEQAIQSTQNKFTEFMTEAEHYGIKAETVTTDTVVMSVNATSSNSTEVIDNANSNDSSNTGTSD